MLAVVVGLLDDRLALAGELALAPASAQHVLVAAGYRQWGAELVQQLRGPFTLLVWDGRQRRGLLAVDQLGARSLFYCRTGRSLAFAADVRELLPLLAATPPPSERAVVRWLVDGVHEPHETLLAGIERLRGGHRLRIGADGELVGHRKEGESARRAHPSIHDRRRITVGRVGGDDGSHPRALS